MHWHDVENDGRAWSALELAVPARSSSWTVEGAHGRLRLRVGTRPLLWARQHPYWQGVWWLRADAKGTSPIDAITSPAIARVKAAPNTDVWLAQWARFFAGALRESSRSPLHEGTWRLSHAFDAESGTAPQGAAFFLGVQRIRDYLTQGSGGFEEWMLDGSQGLLGLRPAPDESSGRFKTWRKRARDGTLPPVLLLFVSPLDMWVVLDGHERLSAALHEGIPPPLLGLWCLRPRPRTPNPALRRGVEQRYFLQDSLGSPLVPQRVDTLNELAVAAWDTRPHLVPVTRGRPLEGGLAAWNREVSVRLSSPDVRVPDDVAQDLLASAS